MALLTPASEELPGALAPEGVMVVACFCAAWCDTCTAYKAKFEALASVHPEGVFVWVDIEDYPDLLGDEDIENFPTVAIEQSGQLLFYGVMLPHIQQLERLMQSLAAQRSNQPVEADLPPLRATLLAH